MPLSRRVRLRSALVVLMSMLFMQLAMAGYVCPSHAKSMTGEVRSAGQVAADNAMPMSDCMLQADQDEPQLCYAHCQADNQSLDKYERPMFQAALPDPVLALVVLLLPTSGLGDRYWEPASMTRVTAPSVAIRNCCFRI